ncbi:MAG: ATP-dependent nuclease [Segniliparus sp.]|uniref:ATP-dependent nuclease n=1 Tax=Segniliparus sp. TaxID=2804064 RepID=UPI003F348F7B
MRITSLRLSNFQSFGPTATEIALDGLNYVLGPNGSGKTAVLEALSRMFSPLPAQRAIRLADFHTPAEQPAGQPQRGAPTLWLEAVIELPEAGADGQHASVPPSFSHMTIDTADGVPQIRVRLTASLDPDGGIDEKIEYVLDSDAAGEPTRCAEMKRHDRKAIEVYYLPARRDPADHLAYTTASLIGRILRATDWTAERGILEGLTDQITGSLSANSVVAGINDRLTEQWQGLHRGEHFKAPSIAFGRGELEGLLRQLTVTFSPSPDGTALSFERLSDGQKSLLYISLVLVWQSLARQALDDEDMSLDRDNLRPPVHTVIALEEPENSLSPQYLGRIIRQLREACAGGDVQALVATHAPTLLRRVDPGSIRFLRLNEARETTVRGIVLPDGGGSAAKYVREAVQAYPELYFSRFVVLGEGASEQVVLPRVLAAAGIAEDDASVSVVPLGGRHVNHFWRLLDELQIPHATLLDLDSGRHQGGWGRVRYAGSQYSKIHPELLSTEAVDKLPKWNDDRDFPTLDTPGFPNNSIKWLEGKGVFFSHPVDLDLMMLAAYPNAYDAEKAEPDEDTISAVLGRGRANEDRIPDDVRNLFNTYRRLFDRGSKPSAHLEALSEMSDDQLQEGLPDVLDRLVEHVRSKLNGLPE